MSPKGESCSRIAGPNRRGVMGKFPLSNDLSSLDLGFGTHLLASFRAFWVPKYQKPRKQHRGGQWSRGAQSRQHAACVRNNWGP